MHEILERALKVCEAAEVFSVRSTSTPVEVEANRLKRIETSEQSGVALRVIKNGRVGFSSTTRPDDVQGLIDAACATAEFGTPAVFEFPGPADFAAVDNFDPRVPEMAVDSLVDTGNDLVDALAAVHPDLLASVNLEKSSHEVSIHNSSGLCVSHRSTQYRAYAVAEVVSGENFLSVYDGTGGSVASLDSEALKQRMVQKFRNGMKNVPLPSGKYPVIMTPMALGDLIQRIISCVNGGAVENGFSPLKDRLETQVTDARVRLYDDQIRPGGAASCPFDDEGSPRRRLPIIEDGVLKNFLLDLRTASRLGRAPTGNGERSSIETAPGIGTSALVIDPGQVTLQQMISGIKRGVMVDTLMGAWSGNPFGGAVNGNIVLGFVIENGEIVGRLKDAMFSANAFEALSERVVAISREQIDYVRNVFPYILLDAIGIVTKS